MPSRSIIAIFLILLVIAAAAAQTASESCSSRTTAYVRAPSTIRESPSHTAAAVRSTTPGEKLDITASQRHGPWCWLQVSDGWIIDGGLALRSQPVNADEPATTIATVKTAATGGACFAGRTAYISGSMNIRASATTSSAATGGARAGDELAVTDSRRGQIWCWLKVNGGWLANTSRVHAQRPVAAARSGGSSSRTPVQQPVSQPIDNCCFVNRQCSTDQEWTDGYRAYQNNECPAPQTERQTGTDQSSTSDIIPAHIPAHIENCCELSNACNSDEDWISGYLARQRNQCKHPTVYIEGGPRFVARVEAALDMLRQRAPSWYDYTINELKHIRQTPEGVLGVFTARRTFDLPPSHTYLWDDADVESAVVWLAGVLVHEACHIYEHKAGSTYSTEFLRFREEVICQSIQMDALEVFDPRRRFNDYLQGLITDFFSRGYEL